MGALALSVLVSACGSVGDGGAGSDVPVGGTESAQGRLSVVTADEATGLLVLRYEGAGRAITYEQRLGPKMLNPPSESDLATNPELPSYEVDARVLDAQGNVFELQMGGDGFIDSSWDMPQVEAIDELGRLQDMRMLAEAVPEMRRLTVPEGLEQLRLNAIQIGESSARAPEKPGEAPLSANNYETKGIIAFGPTSVVKWDFVVRKKSLSFIADHSAVHLRGWSTNNLVFNAQSCNHGTCAQSTAMTTHCVMPGYKPDDGSNARWFYSDGCTTKYVAGSTNGGHNCNDDSELQARAIWFNGPQSTTGGSCSSGGLHNWAPGCTFF